MHPFRALLVAAAASTAALMAGCGGSEPGNQNPRVAFTRMVNFGDSLSDVGTYRTQIVGLNGEGQYTINGDFSRVRLVGVPDGLPYGNWTQYLAAQLHLTQPCAAETGLDSPAEGPLFFMAEAVTTHAGCFNYAQGGARVTDPYGPANRFYFDVLGSDAGALGQLTVPLVQQVAHFTADGNTFAASDLVTVLAGGNDALILRGVNVDGTVAAAQAGVAAGTLTQDQADQMIRDAAAAAEAGMTQAGTELAALILDQVVAGGATHVVVVNLPDLSSTPDAASWNAGVGAIVSPLINKDLTQSMVLAFNAALEAGLGVSGGESSHVEIAYVDAYTASRQQVEQPATFGLTNVTAPACQLDLTQPNATGLSLPPTGTRVPLASSLFCTKDTLAVDIESAMTYQFADTVHPTPYGYRLLAQLVSARLAAKGWL